jgi:hypothetical protein
MRDFKISDIVITPAKNSGALLNIDVLGGVQFWIKEFEVPGFSFEDGEIISGIEHKINTEGNLFEYKTFPVTIILDEYFLTYYKLYTWITSYKPSSDYIQGKTTGNITILDSNKKEIIVNFYMDGIFPQEVENIQYNTYGGDELSMNVTFKIDYMYPDFVKLKALNYI